MKSYHGDIAVKEKYLIRYKQHVDQDRVLAGIGYENGKGCFVGCTLKNYDHGRFPIELGWPVWMAEWADAVFEGLSEKSKQEGAQFGIDLLEAVPVGIDLENVHLHLAIRRNNRITGEK